MTNKIPARTEVTVIGPDDPNMKPLGFRVTERDGVTLFKFDAEGGIDKRPLTNQDDVQPGVQLAVASLFGGFIPMTVEQDKETEGRLVARGGNLLAILEFAEDDRKCWTCVGMINMRGLKKLEITR